MVLLHSEQLGVALLDRFTLLLDPGGVVLQHLDLLERLAAGLFLGLRMHRAQAADVDDELLRLLREAIALEQLGGVGIGPVLEHAVGADDQRRAFGWVDNLYRAAFLLLL